MSKRKDLIQFVSKLEDLGCKVIQAKKSVKVYTPNNTLITCSSTPSCPFFRKHIEGDLRRALRREEDMGMNIPQSLKDEFLKTSKAKVNSFKDLPTLIPTKPTIQPEPEEEEMRYVGKVYNRDKVYTAVQELLGDDIDKRISQQEKIAACELLNREGLTDPKGKEISVKFFEYIRQELKKKLQKDKDAEWVVEAKDVTHITLPESTNPPPGAPGYRQSLPDPKINELSVILNKECTPKELITLVTNSVISNEAKLGIIGILLEE